MPKGGFREGSGRKVGYRKENAKNNRVMIRFSEEEYTILKAKADELGKPVSTYLRDLIISHNEK